MCCIILKNCVIGNITVPKVSWVCFFSWNILYTIICFDGCILLLKIMQKVVSKGMLATLAGWGGV
jgi:hypothetical protein